VRGFVVNAAFVLAALLPTAARASLILNVEQKEVAPSSQDQVVLLDAWLDDPDGVEQFVDGYRFAVDGPSNSTGGVRFLKPADMGLREFPAPSAAHSYLFENFTVRRYRYDIGTTYDRLVAGADRELPEWADVTPLRSGLLAIPVLVSAGTMAGNYDFLVDSAISATRLLPAGAPYVLGQPGRITVTPDPAAATSLALGALLLLRRRW
jgi:hypothetical protein